MDHETPEYLKARVQELLGETTRLENERRMWKNCAESGRKLLDALLLMMQQRFGSEEVGAAFLIQSVADRADRLERDAWCGAAQLAREFVDAASTPMGDYTPDVVTPVGDTTEMNGHVHLDPKTAFIRKWVDRFKAVTNAP